MHGNLPNNKAKSGAVACGGSLSEQEKDGRLQSKRPELLSPPQKSCLHGNLPNKKAKSGAVACGGSLSEQEKTAVCIANDLNYCLHQNQTKKNINFLEKRKSPITDFFFLYRNAIVYTSLCNREIAIQICHYFSLFTLYRASSTSLPCRIARFTRESVIFSPFFAISTPENVVRSFDSDLPRRNE